MRHQRAGKKLGRDSAHRKALYANLAGALIEHGRIKTTEAKAKAVKPLVEQMITLGRRGDLAARRHAVSILRSKDVVHHLFAEVAPRFADRPGGYTRIVKLGPRQGDAADMVYLELVDYEPFGVAVGVAYKATVPLATAGLAIVAALFVATADWESRAPLPIPRTEVAAATVGREIAVVGGYLGNGSSTNEVDFYAPATNRWRRGPNLPAQVNHAAATTSGGRLYVLGGYGAQRSGF